MGYNTHNLNIPKDNPVLNVTQETFLPLPGFEGIYTVSSLGYLHNGRKALVPYQINSGYLCVKLHNNKRRTSVLVHRMVANAFLPNPQCKNEVNHKDGNKQNNAVTNLEWVTSAENKQHAWKAGVYQIGAPTKGQKLGKHSKFHNVTFDTSRQKWVGCVRHEKTNHFPKRFLVEEDAARHVNWILDTLGLQDRPRNLVD